MLAPALGLPHRVLVADDHGGIDIGEELLVIAVGRAAHDEADVACSEVFGDVGQALLQKGVMTQVCVGESC